MSTHNIGFNGESTHSIGFKGETSNYHQLSSNTHSICSPVGSLAVKKTQ